jgi:hypothetical protein
MPRRQPHPSVRALIRPVREAQDPLLPLPVLAAHFSPEQLLRAANAGATFYDAGGVLMGDYSAISLIIEIEGEAA